jgi:siroheme synthase, N-terminal domain
MISYPLNVNLQGKKVIIAGGGRVATRRAEALIDCGACVTVISPQASARIREWAEQQVIVWQKRVWVRTDAQDAFLILAATDSDPVNAEISESVTPNQLICAAGHADLGNFSVPASIRRGRLTITIATDGASPLYAKRLCHRIADDLDEDIEDFLDFLFAFRQQILKRHLSRELRKACLENVLKPEFRSQKKQIEILNDIDQWIQIQSAEHS